MSSDYLAGWNAGFEEGWRSATRPTLIPENRHGVKPGYCTRRDIIALLRKHHTQPMAVHFIADMMEQNP